MRTFAVVLALAVPIGSPPAAARAEAPATAAVAEPGEELSGGATTVFDATSHAFELAARNLDARGRRAFSTGNAFFNDNWVQAPASTEGRDGLGPLFNARSCSACHPKDGRGEPVEPVEGEPHVALLIRLSVPGPNGPQPHPTYGDQLQVRAIPGVPPEGSFRIHSHFVDGKFADGERYVLRRPEYRFFGLNYGAFPDDMMFSPRVGPPVFGLGLLEAVPEAAILARADPDDRDGDGVSGRANRVLDEHGRPALGRFGWKANVATIRQQIAGAFLGDIGITSSLRPRENHAPSQTEAARAPSGGDPELSDDKLDRVNFYSHTLAVPARRNWTDPVVLRGKELFGRMRCAACHVPKLETGALEGFPELSHQTIRPYTDLLLHDMGPDLADGRPDGEATGSEWRTPPLWGIGLTLAVNGHTRFLHDGRAMSLQGAILWHGGEAEASREAFRTAPAEDRAALLAFLNSL